MCTPNGSITQYLACIFVEENSMFHHIYCFDETRVLLLIDKFQRKVSFGLFVSTGEGKTAMQIMYLLRTFMKTSSMPEKKRGEKKKSFIILCLRFLEDF